MGVKLKNNVVGFIDSAISASDIYITLRTGDGATFPSINTGDYFYATLVSASNLYEIVKVTTRVNDILTVVRGQENTTANSFAAGSRLEMRVTAQSVLDALQLLDLLAQHQTFTGDGSTLAFTLTIAPAAPYLTFVMINGIVMKEVDDYSVSDTTVTFTTAPAVSDEIVVRWMYLQVRGAGISTQSVPSVILLESSP